MLYLTQDSWEWLAALKPLFKLKILHIACPSRYKFIATQPKIFFDLIGKRLTQIVLDVNLSIYIHSTTDGLLKSVLESNQITKLCLPSMSHETIAGVYSILLHCPSLVSLELERIRLGYDGILYICSTLRKNMSLKHLEIHDDTQIPKPRNGKPIVPFTSFLSMEKVAFPEKTNCTEFRTISSSKTPL